MVIPNGVKTILNRLNESGYKAYCVGGCVRDFVLSEEPYDWDVATDAEPETVKKVFSGFKTVDTGIKHGTVTVFCGADKAEVTTFRADNGYTDHRRPDSVSFSKSLNEDLSRRDFTINAMAYSEKEGLIDPFGGRRDALNKVIRAVGDPEKRFCEDGLRILRALRFSSTLGFESEKETEKALFKCKGYIKFVSGERIYAEITKLLLGQNALKVLLSYPGVLSEAIPEIAPAVGFDQKSKYHVYDVWEHTSRSVAAAPFDETLRWTMLFHDLGKPDVFSFDGKNGHFYGHAGISAEKAFKRLSYFGVSNEKKDRITRLIRYHDSDLLATEKSIKRWLSRLGEEELLMLVDVKRADNAAQSRDFDRKKELDESEEKIRKTAASFSCLSEKRLKIDGNDIKALGASGKITGIIKRELLDMVLEGKCENEREKLLNEAARLLRKM